MLPTQGLGFFNHKLKRSNLNTLCFSSLEVKMLPGLYLNYRP